MLNRRAVVLSLATAQLLGLERLALGAEAPFAERLSDELFEEALVRVTAEARLYHDDRGYTEIRARPLITGHDFNAGLRHDEFDALAAAEPGSCVIQNIARVEDIWNRNRHDVLAYFHVFFCNWRSGEQAVDALAEKLDFLITHLGMPARRLAVVGADALGPYRQLIEESGIAPERIHQREETMALAMGDGSGWFRPEGHPEGLAVPTVAFYAWLGVDEAPPVTEYPLHSDWIEIGETGLDPTKVISQGFGLERLVYALTGLYPSWHDRRASLLAELDREMSGGAAEPEGYALFRDA